MMEMPSAPLPFPNPDRPSPAPQDLPPPEELGQEGKGGQWYGTRVQTLLLIEQTGTGGHKVVFIERDAYVLGSDGRPAWSGEERRFEFEV